MRPELRALRARRPGSGPRGSVSSHAVSRSRAGTSSAVSSTSEVSAGSAGCRRPSVIATGEDGDRHGDQRHGQRPRHRRRAAVLRRRRRSPWRRTSAAGIGFTGSPGSKLLSSSMGSDMAHSSLEVGGFVGQQRGEGGASAAQPGLDGAFGYADLVGRSHCTGRSAMWCSTSAWRCASGSCRSAATSATWDSSTAGVSVGSATARSAGRPAPRRTPPAAHRQAVRRGAHPGLGVARPSPACAGAPRPARRPPGRTPGPRRGCRSWRRPDWSAVGTTRCRTRRTHARPPGRPSSRLCGSVEGDTPGPLGGCMTAGDFREVAVSPTGAATAARRAGRGRGTRGPRSPPGHGHVGRLHEAELSDGRAVAHDRHRVGQRVACRRARSSGARW